MHYGLSLKEDESGYSDQWPMDCFKRKLGGHHKVALHYHRTLEINVFQNTQGTVRVGAQELDLLGLNVLVIPPQLPHSYELRGGEVVVLHLSLENLNAMVQLEKVLGWKPSILTLPLVHHDYSSLVEIVPHFLTLGKSHRLELLELLLKVFRVFDKARKTMTDTAPGLQKYSSRMNAALLEIIVFSEKSYAKDLDLSTVAGHLGWSQSYFCRFFKRMTGENYVHYLQRLRIDRAKIELAKGASVTEACYGCGFGNLSHFIQVFRAYEGTTPGQFLTRGERETG